MRVLFVDDDDSLRRVLQREIAEFGCEVHAFADAESALATLGEWRADVALIDLRLPGMSGHELLERLRAADDAMPVVFLTGHGNVPDAVAAMRGGAYDFLTKPVELDDLERALRRARDHADLVRENARLRDLIEPHEGLAALVGESAPMRELRVLIRRFAATDQSVLITGENGTGKELVARALHDESPRAAHPFVVVNCGAIPEALVESELFGHEKGAFTGAVRRRTGLFEAAHRGTLFLDELGELPPSFQPKLLRAAQYGEIRRVGSERTEQVDVRIVAATNRDLDSAIEKGEFREDLYYRVATLLIDVPPLRERAEDIAPMVEHFLATEGSSAKFTERALALLWNHPWPGNVRELRNAVARLSALVDSDEIDAPDVERHVVGKKNTRGALPSLDLEDLERSAIVEALRRHRGNRKRAAGELGVAVKTLYNKLRRYDIDAERVLEGA